MNDGGPTGAEGPRFRFFLTAHPNMVFLLCSMKVKLSEILDPRRFAAQKAAAAEAEAVDANPWAAEDAAALASQLADLAELRALAMGLARRVAAEAEPDDAETADNDNADGPLALSVTGASRRDTSPMNGRGEGSARAADKALNGLARTVRLTTALEQKLRAERARGVVLAAQAKAGGRDPREVVEIEHTLLTPEERANLNRRLLIMVRNKNTIVGVVREVLEADGQDEETVDEVGEILGVRLLDWEASDTFNLPIGRMVARICRQMRKVPDWSMFKDRDWAVEEAAQNAEGSPFGKWEISPVSWCAGVATPHRDAGTLEILARGFEDEAEDGDDPPGSSP